AGHVSPTQTASTTSYTPQTFTGTPKTPTTTTLLSLHDPLPTLLTITTTSSQLPTGTVSTAYPATNLTASGGTPPYAWSVTTAASTFSAGLSIRILSGFCGPSSTAETFNFNDQVTDSVYYTATTQ